ncbi:MAG: acyltransferase family protein, partial [Bacilli bacterium]|nr:acyltransferase family protein [Bacilli bacterium]
MNKVKRERNYSLDIVRIFALFCVVSVHFFLRNNFYGEIIQGKTLFASTIIRSFFMICVPLFLILSGYLSNKKEPTKSYFIGIKKVIIQYLICSLINFAFCLIYFKTKFSLYNLFFGMFNYTNARYAWYVEMYLGLYLLIPFLNVVYNNLKTKKDKQTLLIVLIITTILPSIGSIFNFKMVNIFSAKVPSEKLLPTYWVNFYPITYYFVGCYLNEFKINMSKIKNVIYIILSTLVFGVVSILVNYKNLFSWNLYQSYGSLF